MPALIEAIPPQTLESELANSQPLRHFRGLEIHALHGDDFPATLQEIGRLREAVFRQAGAGRGLPCDLDELDRGPAAYRQLVVWDPAQRELVALYRYQLGARAMQWGEPSLRTSQLFHYSDHFRRHCLPWSIELGRSLANPHARRRQLGMFALWAGLGALLKAHPEVRYFFGNVSLYRQLPSAARESLIAFLENHYAPPEAMLIAREGLRHRPSATGFDEAMATDGKPGDRIQYLREQLAAFEVRIPPILQSYLGLGNGIYFGETAVDQDFGEALEIGIVVPVNAIEDDIRERFVNPDQRTAK